MKILFIGGNGNISWYCVQKALEAGDEVWELNRSMTLDTRKKIQSEVHKITGDIRNVKRMENCLADCYFDVVCDFICFNEEHAQQDVTLFIGKTDHFVFISTESIYKRSGKKMLFKEEHEKNSISNSGEYVRGKLLAEDYFIKRYKNDGFPVTIVRPSYTYDVIVPVSVGHNCFTAPQKFLEGYPALIAGEGTNLWSFTHSSDFATAFIPLIKNKDTIGQDFHIATDEWLSWNEEMEILFHALKISQYQAIHIPWQEVAEINFFQSKDLMMQRMMPNIYDVSKVKSYVPGWKAKKSFEAGIAETCAWLGQNVVRRRINFKYQESLELLYQKYMGGY